MADSVKSAFDLTAGAYDRTRRQWVPCFDDFYRAVIDLLSCDRAASLEVLDLGAGTGLLAGFIADAFPAARITLVDVAPKMLGRARDRFAAAPNRVSDYCDVPIDGCYDAIVSGLDRSSRRRGQAWSIRPHPCRTQSGGIFVNAEQKLGPTAAAASRHRATWLRQVRERTRPHRRRPGGRARTDEARSDGATRSAADGSLRRASATLIAPTRAGGLPSIAARSSCGVITNGCAFA
jgi:tRNA (cmo5U34)-methyltransferase